MTRPHPVRCGKSRPVVCCGGSVTDVSVGGLTMIEAVLTPAMFRNRAYDCQRLAERAPNQRVRDILLDMSRTWNRLALEAEEWRRDNSPRSRLAKKDATKDRPKIISPNPLPLPASPPEPPDS
jgi:hypothetical protein